MSFVAVTNDADPKGTFAGKVDGSAEVSFAMPDVAPYGTSNDFFFTGKSAQALLDRLVPGKSLSLRFELASGHEAGTREIRFPLAGLSQALIWIDGEQHRIGSERVTEPPPFGLLRADWPASAWMEPALLAVAAAHR
jgi:hypothetical protein